MCIRDRCDPQRFDSGQYRVCRRPVSYTHLGQIASNQANATAAGGISANSDDNGNPGDGLNPTLTPIGPVATFAGLSKSLVATSNGGDTSTAVQIGEILTYQIQFNVPAGTTGEVTMVDTLPAGLSYVVGTARLARQFGTGLTASRCV